MRCENCNIQTDGARDDQDRTWPICGACLDELITETRRQIEAARNAEAALPEYDPLTICARCRFTWPVSELSGGICPDCNVRAWEITSTREVLR